jgi:PBP1b-binding outer membrane lipoprotein LpoB
MRHRARKSIVVAILFSALLMTGCNDKLVKAATAAKDLAQAVHVVQDTEIAMYHQNLVDKDEHIAFQKLLIDVSNSGIELSNAILVLKSKPDAIAALDKALASTNTLLDAGTLHIKNEQARTQISVAIVAVRGLLATIEVAAQR